MRFLVDECTGPSVACWLRDKGHEVYSVFDEARGSVDDEIVQKAFSENWILITNDKDFGDKVFRDGRLHSGIILLRLEDETANSKIRGKRQFIPIFTRSASRDMMSSKNKEATLWINSREPSSWNKSVAIGNSTSTTGNRRA